MPSAGVIAQSRIRPGFTVEDAAALARKWKPIAERHGAQAVRLFSGMAGGGPQPFTTVSVYTEFADFAALGAGIQAALSDPEWAPIAAEWLGPDSALEYADSSIIIEADL